MVPVADYLKKLLYQYDCLIVPELGGFILHYIPATYIESTGMYLPPRKKIAYNEALKLDDGLLTTYMMLHEQLTREEVLQRIRSFVDELRQTVFRSGSFTVEGVGLFLKNEEGKLLFDPEQRHNFYGDSFGLQSTVTKKKEPSYREDIIATILDKDSNLIEEVVHSKVETVVKPASPRTHLTWAATFLLVSIMGLMSYMTFTRPPGQAASSLSPLDIISIFKSSDSVSKRIGIKKEAYTLRAIRKVKAVSALEQLVAQGQKVQMNTAMESRIRTVNPEISLVEDRHVHYMAIAGSFIKKRNAKKLLRQLYCQGFKTAHIIMPKRKGELIKVAAWGSENREEVVAALGKVGKLSHDQAWVYKYTYQ